jgi:chemotaxis response regulator CheB
MPSGKKIFIEDMVIKVIERPVEEKINESIDYFVLSLANEMKEKAVGVILSGTGTDGLKGLKAIKDNNGIVLVQDSATADFDALPNNVIHLDHPGITGKNVPDH